MSLKTFAYVHIYFSLKMQIKRFIKYLYTFLCSTFTPPNYFISSVKM